MTRAPLVMAKPEQDFPRGNMEIYDTTIGWRFTNKRLHEMYGSLSMPETAEEVAKRFNISRVDQDQFALDSQRKTGRAQESGVFHEEIVPVEIRDRKRKIILVDQDEHPRVDTTLEKLSSVNTIVPNGTVTAGNTSGVNDGASALLLMNAKKAKGLGLQPLARIVSTAIAGVEPNIMGIGPVNETEKALQRAGLSVEDLDLKES